MVTGRGGAFGASAAACDEETQKAERETGRRRSWSMANRVSTGSPSSTRKPADSRKIDSGDREIWDYAWSLDGSQLAYATAEAAGEDAPMNRGDIWLVGRDGNDPRHVAQLNETPFGLAFVDGPMESGSQFGRAASASTQRCRSIWSISEPERSPISCRSSRQRRLARTRSRARRARLPSRPPKACIPISTASMSEPANAPHSLPRSLSSNGALPYPPSVSADGTTVAALWSASDIPEEIYLDPRRAASQSS